MDALLATVMLEPLRLLAPRRVVVLGLAEPLVLRTLLAITREAGSELHYVTSQHVRFETGGWPSADAERLTIHANPSRSQLAELAPWELVVVDVEPNWFTTGRAIRAVIEAARRTDSPLPMLLVPNVGWPHGDRDAYGNPDNIPEGARHDHALGGLRLGGVEPDPDGGIDRLRHHAVEPGGPRNGVMAAFRDALAPEADEYRAFGMAGFHGLAVAWPRRFTTTHPELVERLEQLATPHPMRDLVERLEIARLRAEVGRQDLGAVDAATAITQDIDVEHRRPAEIRELASALIERSRGDAALRLLLAACRKNPDDLGLHLALGRSAMRLNRAPQALPAFRRAAEIEQDEPAILLELGQAASRAQGNEDEAERTIRRAIDLAPDSPRAQVLLASHLRLTGNLDEAAKRCQRVLERHPDNLSALAVLGHLDQLTPDQLERAHELSADTNLSTHEVANVHFSLAKAFDRAKDFGRAFDHARRANELHKILFRSAHGAAYDPDAHRELVDATIATYTKDVIERFAEAGSTSRTPLVIGGLPRSGTTLTEQILASHSAVHGGGELGLIGAGIRHIRQATGAPGGYPASLLDASPDDISEAGRLVVEAFAARDPDAAHVTDKMPQNFLHHGAVAAMVPGARQFTLLRDPRDVFVSSYFQGFTSPGLTYSCDQTWFAFYAREHTRLLAHWQDVIPDLFVVDYAELTREQEAVSRELVAHAGLEWEDACLDFHTTKRPIHTASATQVRQPMYTSSVERWRRYEPWLDELLTGLAEGTPYEHPTD